MQAKKQAKKRSLCMINEHFETVFNAAAATQIVFQRPVNSNLTTVCHFFVINDEKVAHLFY